MLNLEFLITSLVVVLIPGTGVIFTISTGLTQGRKASVFAALGCTSGILPHLMATVLGLAALMHTSAVAFQTLKYAGVAYLFYIAFATWRDKSTLAIEEKSSASTATGLILKAFLLNILNPKLTIFFLAFLAMTFVVFVGYGCLAHAFRKTVVDSPRIQTWLRRSFAAAFDSVYLGSDLGKSSVYNKNFEK
jgi:threonine/homoserine/homoserine lactone efflux protein